MSNGAVAGNFFVRALHSYDFLVDAIRGRNIQPRRHADPICGLV